MTASGLDSWYHEKESAWLYRQVAAAEPDPRKRELFLKLAAAAEEQADKWQRAARPATAPERLYAPSLRARIVARLLRRFEARSLRMVLAAMKLRGLSVYGAAPAAPGTPCRPRSAQVGARHRSAVGGSLRAAVFGVNDGLVSNVSLVLGVAGAGVSSDHGAHRRGRRACSPVRSPWLPGNTSRCARSARCTNTRSRSSARSSPSTREEEAEELALIYHARGVELEQARAVSRALLANPRAGPRRAGARGARASIRTTWAPRGGPPAPRS